MSEHIVDGAVPNHTVRVEDEREVYWHMTHLPVREEIVRCCDCESCEQLPPEKDKQFYRWCYELSRHVTKNEFCAWGERRDA